MRPVSPGDPNADSSISARLRRGFAAVSMDLTPLRASAGLRWLLSSRTVSLFGAQATAIALLVQAKQLTGSAFAVGLLGAVEIPPVVIFGLYGGHLADRIDRRMLARATEAALGAVTVGLLANALVAHPLVWPLYPAAAAIMALAALQRPALDATVPRIVDREQLTAAAALLALSSNAAFIGGSAVGGVVIAALGAKTAYALAGGTYLLSLLCMQGLPRLAVTPTPADEPRARALHELLVGIRYVAGRQELIGSYLVDLAAMSFAFPEALFPFMASTLHANWALGLMFAAGAVGALLASATSRWTTRVDRHGVAIALAGAGFGVAIAAFGLSPDIATALVALVAAGAADLISGVFRDTLWNQTIPDRLRGRVAGAEVVSYGLGPAVGQLRGGAVAGAVNVRFSLWSGGALCVCAIAITAIRLPKFIGYRASSPPDTTLA